MPVRTLTGRLPTLRRVLTVLCLLVAVGVLVTPIQWTVAYLGLERENRRRRRARLSSPSHRADAVV